MAMVEQDSGRMKSYARDLEGGNEGMSGFFNWQSERA